LGALALGFGDMHKHGIIHMDIHPGNIMKDEKGFLNLVDFGAA